MLRCAFALACLKASSKEGKPANQPARGRLAARPKPRGWESCRCSSELPSLSLSTSYCPASTSRPWDLICSRHIHSHTHHRTLSDRSSPHLTPRRARSPAPPPQHRDLAWRAARRTHRKLSDINKAQPRLSPLLAAPDNKAAASRSSAISLFALAFHDLNSAICESIAVFTTPRHRSRSRLDPTASRGLDPTAARAGFGAHPS